MPVLTWNAGVTGLPTGTKEGGRRVDFRTDEFTVILELKGYRLAWSRAALCPCAGVNEQTEQPDPNCQLCKGHGFFYYKPAGAVVDERRVGALDALQQRIAADAAVIRGIMTGLAAKEIPHDTVLSRMEGTSSVTTRWENKLGYWDRLVNLDSLIVYSQLLVAGPAPLTTRYPVAKMEMLRTLDRPLIDGTGGLVTDPDYQIVAGDIVWFPGQAPDAGTKLAAHYLCHPAWRVIEHPHATRTTSVKFKTTSPVGDPKELPNQAVVRYEFLP